jgi:hypothetical protein
MKRMNLILCAIFVGTGCTSLTIKKNDAVSTKIVKGTLRVPLCLVSIGYSEWYYKIDRNMASWIGHHKSELLMSWGPPSQVVPDGLGGELFVYSNTKTYISPSSTQSSTYGSATAHRYGNTAHVYGHANTYTTHSPSQVYQYNSFRQFRVNVRGMITNYSWSGW